MKDPLEEIYERRIIADRIAQKLIENQQMNKEIFKCEYCKKEYSEHLDKCLSCGGVIKLITGVKPPEDQSTLTPVAPLTTSPLQFFTALLIIAVLLIIWIWVYSFLQ